MIGMDRKLIIYYYYYYYYKALYIRVSKFKNLKEGYVM